MTVVMDLSGRRPDLPAVRAYTGWGLIASMVALSLPAARTLLEGMWPAPAMAGLSAVLLTTVGAHLAVSLGVLRGRAVAVWSPMVALALSAPTFAVLVAIAPEQALPWAVVVGIGASALLVARGWGWLDIGAVLVLAVIAGAVAGTAGVPPGAAAWARPVAVTAVLVLAPFIDAGQVWIWRTVQRLDAARELEVELATTRERARIAAELHDVQGHSLHVIAMHAELVERLVLADPPAAREHARTVRKLAADALAETRSLVHGYRASDVAAEVRNAAEVLRAAGAQTVVRGDPALLPAAAAPLFAPLMREATTNIVRHSTATRVEIVVTARDGEVRLTVANDGVEPGRGGTPGLVGTGLAGLRRRFEGRGGSLTTGEGPPGTWLLTGVVPQAPTPQQER